MRITINIMLFYYFMLLKLIYTDITATRYTYDLRLKIRYITVFYPERKLLRYAADCQRE